MKSIDGVLHLSHNFGLKATNPGILVVEFLYSIVSQLLDASLDDEGLLELMPEMKSRWATKPKEMEIDTNDNYNQMETEYHVKLYKMNTIMAIEMIGKLFQDKSTSRILDLVRQNLYVSFILYKLLLKIIIQLESLYDGIVEIASQNDFC